MNRSFRWLLLPLFLMVLGPASAPAAGQPAPKRAQQPELTEKEAFMLLFGKGNGAMRVLCALERDGLISTATRRRYSERLEDLLTEPGDSATDRRNARIGMAFADGRASLCPARVLENPKR